VSSPGGKEKNQTASVGQTHPGYHDDQGDDCQEHGQLLDTKGRPSPVVDGSECCSNPAAAFRLDVKAALVHSPAPYHDLNQANDPR